MFTIQSLLDEATQLERQIEAAANMVQQTAGALNYVRNKINQVQQAHEEAARLAKEQKDKEDALTLQEGDQTSKGGEAQ